MTVRVEVRATTSRAGCFWRGLQTLGFLAMAVGLASAWITWGDRGTSSAPVAGAIVSLVGAAVFFASRGLAWLIHG